MASNKYKLFLFFWKQVPFKKNILNVLKRCGVSNKIIGDLYLNDKFEISFQGLSFFLYNKRHDKSSFEIYLNGLDKSWDRFSLKIWKIISEDSDVIFDVGTNIGLYCIVSKLANKKARVIGFEPSVKAYLNVNNNIKINKLDIKVEQKGLSDVQGKITFYDLDKHTAVSSIELNDNLKNSAGLISYEVEITTLDQYVDENEIQKVDLVSIDVEAHEEQVLLGMSNVLKNFRPTILIEVLNADLGMRIQKKLDEYSYRYYFVNEDGYLLPTSDLSKRPHNFLHSYNVLAVQRSIVEQQLSKNFDLWD